MRLELTGRHVDIAPALRRLIERKLARLERMLNDSALSAQVVLTREKRGHRADVTLHARGEKFLHGVGESTDWEPSMSLAVDKIVQQAKKIKGKWQERKRKHISVPDGAIVETTAPRRAREPRPREARPREPRAREPRTGVRMPRILQASRQTLRSMSVSDAAREIDAAGEGLVVFRDIETAVISVLYKRTNGELTLIETEV